MLTPLTHLATKRLGRRLLSSPHLTARTLSSSTADVTVGEVENLQAAWANAITTISGVYKEKGDYVKVGKVDK
jgi:hypothetical protein